MIWRYIFSYLVLSKIQVISFSSLSIEISLFSVKTIFLFVHLILIISLIQVINLCRVIVVFNWSFHLYISFNVLISVVFSSRNNRVFKIIFSNIFNNTFIFGIVWIWSLSRNILIRLILNIFEVWSLLIRRIYFCLPVNKIIIRF